MEKRPLLIPSSYQKNSNKQIIKLKESWHEIFTKFHRIIKSSEIYTRLFISYVIYVKNVITEKICLICYQQLRYLIHSYFGCIVLLYHCYNCYNKYIE